jgi:hypothetical protein
MRLPAQAGHDASLIASVAPTGMRVTVAIVSVVSGASPAMRGGLTKSESCLTRLRQREFSLSVRDESSCRIFTWGGVAWSGALLPSAARSLPWLAPCQACDKVDKAFHRIALKVVTTGIRSRRSSGPMDALTPRHAGQAI